MINDLKFLVSPMGVKKKKKELRLREVPAVAQGHTAQQLTGGWTGERQG